MTWFVRCLSFILPLTYTWYTIYWLVCCRMSMLCFLAPHRLVVTLTKDALKSAICWAKYPVCQKMIAKKILYAAVKVVVLLTYFSVHKSNSSVHLVVFHRKDSLLLLMHDRDFPCVSCICITTHIRWNILVSYQTVIFHYTAASAKNKYMKSNVLLPTSEYRSLLDF